jgi:hypothetical protein
MPCLLLKVVIGDFDVAKLESKCPVSVAQRGYFFLQCVQVVVGIAFCFVVLGLCSSVFGLSILKVK